MTATRMGFFMTGLLVRERWIVAGRSRRRCGPGATGEGTRPGTVVALRRIEVVGNVRSAVVVVAEGGRSALVAVALDAASLADASRVVGPVVDSVG